MNAVPLAPDRYPSASAQAGYAVSIVVNAILLYIVHHVTTWGVPFLTPAFEDVLWAIDLSLGATIVANAFFMAYDRGWFRHLSEMVLDALALLSTYTLYRVFPFQFDDAWWYQVAGVALLAVMLAVSIALIVNALKAVADGLSYAGT
jgi:hypothetical protein